MPGAALQLATPPHRQPSPGNSPESAPLRRGHHALSPNPHPPTPRRQQLHEARDEIEALHSRLAHLEAAQQTQEAMAIRIGVLSDNLKTAQENLNSAREASFELQRVRTLLEGRLQAMECERKRERAETERARRELEMERKGVAAERSRARRILNEIEEEHEELRLVRGALSEEEVRRAEVRLQRPRQSLAKVVAMQAGRIRKLEETVADMEAVRELLRQEGLGEAVQRAEVTVARGWIATRPERKRG